VESLMPDDLVARMNLAVDECLDRCSKSSTPAELTVQGFLVELKELGWAEEDIGIVQSTVARLLGQLAKGH